MEHARRASLEKILAGDQGDLGDEAYLGNRKPALFAWLDRSRQGKMALQQLESVEYEAGFPEIEREATGMADEAGGDAEQFLDHARIRRRLLSARCLNPFRPIWPIKRSTL